MDELSWQGGRLAGRQAGKAVREQCRWDMGSRKPERRDTSAHKSRNTGKHLRQRAHVSDLTERADTIESWKLF